MTSSNELEESELSVGALYDEGFPGVETREYELSAKVPDAAFIDIS
jgi:hypothetical protein